jgi:benzaldehyde dehydrogenase (NAD)
MPLLAPQERWSAKVFTGAWEDTGAVLTSREPATGRELGTVGSADADVLGRCAAAAARAGDRFAASPPHERAAIVLRAHALLEENRAELREMLMREAGKVRAAAELELDLTAAELMEAARLTSTPSAVQLPTAVPGRTSIARRVPYGVVAVIAPWNFPLNLAMRSVAPALACGNAVILKPASHTAICCGVAIARVFEEAGLPPGTLHMLPGRGSELGTAFAEDPNIDLISFTGSTPVGRRLNAAAAEHLKKFVAELGGNNAFLVLADADPDVAATAGAYGSFTHQGQICMATGRHLVAAPLAERYGARLGEIASALRVGDPCGDVDLGPVIDDSQADHIMELIERSVAAGARVISGNERDGRFLRPTVLAEVTPEMPVYAEEIFGPVAAITAVRNDEEAIALANDTPYGLVAAVHAGSLAHARAVGDRLDAGMVHLNDQTVNDEAIAPFGGRKDSGSGGRFGALTNLEEFTVWQWVTAQEEQFAPRAFRPT